MHRNTRAMSDYSRQSGFTLIELISTLVLVGVLSVTLLFRLGNVHSSAIQSSRDDLIAALFFAQQQAMMRENISLVITSNSITVNENNAPIVVPNNPLPLPNGVAVTPVVLNYDKLGRTTATTITLTGSGNSSGVSTRVRVEASGYAFAN